MVNMEPTVSIVEKVEIDLVASIKRLIEEPRIRESHNWNHTNTALAAALEQVIRLRKHVGG